MTLRRTALLLAALTLTAGPAMAVRPTAPDPLSSGLAGALRGCEAWVLEPASWTGSTAPFLKAMGLDGRVSEVGSVPEQLLPPPSLRRANRYWRISAKGEDGFVLVVSEDLPMCHIVGGGSSDLQPAAEALIATSGFAKRWEHVADEREAGILSTRFRSREEPAFTILFSRAEAPNARRDRPQVIVTGFYEVRK